MHTPLYLKEADWLDLINDPVMAAEIIMNCKLDVHQAVRLRYYWWCANVMDDSGVGTGKSTITFIWQALRHILLPHPKTMQTQLIALFYPTLATAKETVGDQFEKFIQTAPIFRSEVAATTHGGKRYAIRSEEGYMEFRYRNGGITRMPAIGMKTDGNSLASRRYTHGVVDEQKEIDKASKVLDKQILQRCNGPTPNKSHPLFTNHVKLLGHAEDPNTHAAAKRHFAYKKIIREGNQNYAILTSSFRDWTPSFKHMVNDDEIRRDYITLPSSEFEQRRGGNWVGDSEQWYEAEKMHACMSRSCMPLDMRTKENATALICIGKDVAKGRGAKSDLNGVCAWMAIPLDHSTLRTHTGIYVDRLNNPWLIRPIFGISSKGQGAPELSGVVHSIHQAFSLNRIIIDPGGGGQWILSETHKSRQIINGIEKENVTGLCEWTQASMFPTAQPLIHTFSHGQLWLRNVMEQKFFSSPDGPNEGMHRLALKLINTQSLLLPPLYSNPTNSIKVPTWTAAETQHWSPMQQQSAKYFDLVYHQLLSISYEKDKDGNPRLSKNHFLRFNSKEKKDAAYAWLYGLCGVISLIDDPDHSHHGEEED